MNGIRCPKCNEGDLFTLEYLPNQAGILIRCVTCKKATWMLDVLMEGKYGRKNNI